MTYSITHPLNAKTVAGPNQEPVRWEAVRFVLAQTYNILPVAQPLKDLYGRGHMSPNQRIGFHADARPTMSTIWACVRPPRTIAPHVSALGVISAWPPVQRARAIAAT